MTIHRNEYVIVILCKKIYLKCQITYNIIQVKYYYLFIFLKKTCTMPLIK